MSPHRPLKGKRLEAATKAEREKDQLRATVAARIEQAITLELVPIPHIAGIRDAIKAMDFAAMGDALAWIGVRAARRAGDWEALDRVLAEQCQGAFRG